MRPEDRNTYEKKSVTFKMNKQANMQMITQMLPQVSEGCQLTRGREAIIKKWRSKNIYTYIREYYLIYEQTDTKRSRYNMSRVSWTYSGQGDAVRDV